MSIYNGLYVKSGCLIVLVLVPSIQPLVGSDCFCESESNSDPSLSIIGIF